MEGLCLLAFQRVYFVAVASADGEALGADAHRPALDVLFASGAVPGVAGVAAPKKAAVSEAGVPCCAA